LHARKESEEGTLPIRSILYFQSPSQRREAPLQPLANSLDREVQGRGDFPWRQVFEVA